MELVLTGVKFAQDSSLGMRTAAAADNASVTISGPPSIDPVKAQSQVTAAVAQGPDAMGIDPFTPDLWQHTLSTVTRQMKNVEAVNDPPVLEASQAASAIVKTYVGISNSQYGTELATATIKNAHLPSSTTGTVLLGQCVPGKIGVLAQRNTAMLNVIHQMLPNTNVIQFDSQVVPTANTVAWTNELQAHPNPVLALGGCDQDGTSLDILKKKLGQHFVAAGVDLTPEALSGVADGTLVDALVEDYYVQGYIAEHLLAEAARGKPLPQGWVDTGLTLVTKSNVAAITQANQSDAAAIAYWKPQVDAYLANPAQYVHPLEQGF